MEPQLRFYNARATTPRDFTSEFTTEPQALLTPPAPTRDPQQQQLYEALLCLTSHAPTREEASFRSRAGTSSTSFTVPVPPHDPQLQQDARANSTAARYSTYVRTPSSNLVA